MQKNPRFKRQVSLRELPESLGLGCIRKAQRKPVPERRFQAVVRGKVVEISIGCRLKIAEEILEIYDFLASVSFGVV